MKSFLLLSLLGIAAIGVSAQTPQRGNGRLDPTVIASGQELPYDLAVDDESVYWVNNYSTIMKVSKAGGTPITVATGQSIYRLLIDENNIYYNVLGEIRRVSKSGGPPVTLATAPMIGYSGYPLVAMDETNIYFIDALDDIRQKVMKVRKSGSAPVVLASKKIYLPTGLVSDGANVYWTDLASSTVKKVSVNGGPTVIFGACNNPVDVAADADRIYCLRKSSEIVRFRKSSRRLDKPSTNSNYYNVEGMALDEMNVYIMSFYKGVYGIYKTSKRGGEPVLSMPLRWQPMKFAIDDTSIYLTNHDQGTVMRLRK